MLTYKESKLYNQGRRHRLQQRNRFIEFALAKLPDTFNPELVTVKFDKRASETQNLWVETEHKINPNQAAFVPAGISVAKAFYLIGNYQELFLFDTQELINLLDAYETRFISTSIGVLLPKNDASRFVKWQWAATYQQELFEIRRTSG